jgi:tetratricopeptide (TPR) repeat protein
MIRPAPFGAALLCAAGLAAGWLSVPGEPERLAMLVRDGRYQEALARLEALDADVAEEPALLYEAFALNDRFGHPQRAEAALLSYLERRPDDVDTHRRAVAFLHARNRHEAMIAVLERLAALAPDLATLDRLTRLYRLDGRIADELRLLRARARIPGRARGGLAWDDEMRLGQLLAERGEGDEAIAAFVRAQSAAPGAAEPRRALFIALVAASRFGEAAEKAKEWLAQPGSARWELGYYATALIRAGAAAPQVLGLAPVGGPDGDRVLADLVFAFTSEGRSDLVRAAIRSWLEAADGLGPAEMDRHLRAVVELAVGRGLARDVYVHLAAAVHDEGGPAELASLAAAVHEHFGYAGIAPVRHLLGYDALSARPLLGAALSAEEGNLIATRHFLLAVDTATLSRREALAWWGLAHEKLPRRELLALAVVRFREGRLPAELVRPMIGLAQKAGRQDVLREVWTALSQQTAALPSSPTARGSGHP